MNKFRLLLQKHRILIYSFDQNVETVQHYVVIRKKNIEHAEVNKIFKTCSQYINKELKSICEKNFH